MSFLSLLAPIQGVAFCLRSVSTDFNALLNGAEPGAGTGLALDVDRSFIAKLKSRPELVLFQQTVFTAHAVQFPHFLNIVEESPK
ncbi:MAG: hypothetical protein C0618_03870 [Desulfuromonas sp.]|nr:MAG: hypothetical protein C0618_03870 [Desulfuromonas sp.]